MKRNFHSLREELIVKEDVDEDRKLKDEEGMRMKEDMNEEATKLQESGFFVDAKKKKEEKKSLGRFRILCLFT